MERLMLEQPSHASTVSVPVIEFTRAA
jgi:hypothetical protein